MQKSLQTFIFLSFSPLPPPMSMWKMPGILVNVIVKIIFLVSTYLDITTSGSHFLLNIPSHSSASF